MNFNRLIIIYIRNRGEMKYIMNFNNFITLTKVLKEEFKILSTKIY